MLRNPGAIQSSRLSPGAVLTGCFLLLVSLAVSDAQVPSAITPDGTLGTVVTPDGRVFNITGGTRPDQGPNLFHSFGQFDVGTDDTAHFVGQPGIDNIIGRVTGGSESLIDGRLQSDASLFLLNPSGLMFGPNATLDVNGSFHASTADILHFADGTAFSARLNEKSTLTVAAPAAFGFLQENPAPITIQGSRLQVAKGEMLSIVGGDIEIVGEDTTSALTPPRLAAPGGQINLASVASAGEVVLEAAGDTPDFDVSSFATLGAIEIKQNALIDTSGDPGGTVVVRSDSLTVHQSLVTADTLGDVDGAEVGIDITAESVYVDRSLISAATFGEGHAGNIMLDVGTLDLTSGGMIDSTTLGTGQGGDVIVTARQGVTITGASTFDNPSDLAGIFAGTMGPGNAGRVTISASTLISQGFASISTSTFDEGNAGSIEIEVDSISLSEGARIFNNTLGTGPGGTVTVTASESLSIRNGGMIGTSAFDRGNAGQVTISTPSLLMDGGNIQAVGQEDSTGDAGVVRIEADQISLAGSALIDSSADGAGRGGDITVISDDIRISDTGSTGKQSGFLSEATSRGDAGNLTISTSTLTMDGGVIRTRTIGEGNAGAIEVHADRITLTDGAQLDSTTASTGQGGAITVMATDLTIDNSLINASTFSNIDGGGIDIHLTGDLVMSNPGGIFAVTLGNGRGGDIFVEAGSVTLTEGAQINNTTSNGIGQGGNLTVIARDAVSISGCTSGLLPCQSALVANTHGAGHAGRVFVSTPILNIDDGVIQALTIGDGNAGEVRIEVGRLTLTGGAQISSSSGAIDINTGKPDRGSGQGGNLTIIATKEISISGSKDDFPSTLTAETIGHGNAGDLSITTPILRMEGGRISSSTTDDGNAGDLTIDVGQLTVSGGAQIASASGNDMGAVGNGRGGLITITAADEISISDPSSGIFSNTFGSGAAGNIDITASTLRMENEGAIEAGGAGGQAGDIEIGAGNVFLTDSTVIAEASQADGGNIILTVSSLLWLRDSAIAATVRGGPETVGGNITIEPEFGVLENSQIRSNANQGRGGDINIEAGVLLADPNSLVSAIALNSEVGIDGEVNVEAVATNLSGLVTPLPPGFASASSLLRDQCAARLREGQLSSLVVSGREGVPARPGSVLPSPLFRADRNRMGTPKQAEPLAEAVASHPEGDGAPAHDMHQGWMSFHHGNFEQAARHWQEAVRALEREGEADQQSVALAHLAHAYQKLGHYQQALQSLQAAQTLAARSGDQVLEAFILGELGNVHMPLGRLHQASQYLYDGLRLAREMKADELVAVILNNRGNLFVSQEAFNEALRAYKESARLAQLTGNHALTARALTNAALITLRREEPQEAQALLDQALPMLQALNPSPEKASGLVSIGLIYTNLRSHLPAMDASLLQFALRSFNDAIAVAQATSDDRAASYAWGYLGHLYEGEGRYQEALALTRRAVFAVQHVQAPEASYQWQWQSGRVLNALGNSEAAMAAYRQAIHTLQSIRHEMLVAYGEPLRFRETVGPVYAEFVGLLLQPGAAKEALEEARQVLESLKVAELQNYFQDECVAALRLRDTSLDAVSQTAVVVYPILLSDRTELLVSLPTRAGQSKLQRFGIAIGADRITQEVRAFRQELENRTTQQYLRHAQKLYDWLIRPLEPTLASLAVTTLVFVPDGPLRTIPMAALHDGEQFLIQKYALAITPGLNLTDPRPLQQPARVLAAGLTQSVQGFSSLPYVETELQAIANLYQSDLLLNQDFQVSRLENTLDRGLFSVIHIASHGQFSSDLDDTFILAVNDKLTLERLDQLLAPLRFRDKPIELLTLSACQTAAGDDRAALGLAGVAVRAGARSALATLWYINDQASSELVSAFYRQLRIPSVSRAIALQRAQIGVLSDPNYQHPAYWAPFLLINNWL